MAAAYSTELATNVSRKSKGLTTKTTWMSLCETLPTNVFVWAEKERWNNGEEHAIILKVLGFALRPYPDTMHPIVYFDSARTHPADECLAELARPSIRAAAIPPRRTRLRQPLDTHVFWRFQSTVVSSMSWEATGISPLLWK